MRFGRWAYRGVDVHASDAVGQEAVLADALGAPGDVGGL